jgi:2'-5' RNA ligase
MRLFTAISLNAAQKIQIEAWRNRQISDLELNAIPMDNFHITLAFYSHIHVSLLERFIQNIETKVLAQFLTPIELHINQAGYWPKTGIYWLGPTEWPKSLQKLAHSLISAGTGFGCKKNKQTYQPHISLYRSIEQAPYAIEKPDIRLHLDHVTLFESEPTHRRVRYKEIVSWSCNKR